MRKYLDEKISTTRSLVFTRLINFDEFIFARIHPLSSSPRSLLTPCIFMSQLWCEVHFVLILCTQLDDGDKGETTRNWGARRNIFFCLLLVFKILSGEWKEKKGYAIKIYKQTWDFIRLICFNLLILPHFPFMPMWRRRQRTPDHKS